MTQDHKKQAFELEQRNSLDKPLIQSEENVEKQQCQFNLADQIVRTSSKRQKIPSILKSVMKKSSRPTNSQIQLNPFTTQIVKQIMMNQKCKLCQNFVQQQISICNCPHTFCNACLNLYVYYRLETLQPIVCPEEGCQKAINQESKFYQDMPQNYRKRAKIQKLYKQHQDDPNTKLCPNQNCTEGLINLLAKPPICNKCQQTYCKECELQAHQGPCQNQFQKKFNQWKRCPKCKMFIEKNEGCNHITCKCQHQFCYVCLADWQNSHYQCGQNNGITIGRKIIWILSLLVVLLIWILMIGFLIQFGAIISMISLPLNNKVQQLWAKILLLIPLGLAGLLIGGLVMVVVWFAVIFYIFFVLVMIICAPIANPNVQNNAN